jgi:hypothetical protein
LGHPVYRQRIIIIIIILFRKYTGV